MTIEVIVTVDRPYRVWVGCLACYNNGLLLGDWFDADSCPDDQESFNAVLKTPASHIAEGHEEFWVFDHENSPVDGEYSPMDAQQYAEWLEGLHTDDYEAFRAYLSNGFDFDDKAVDDFHEAYNGKWDSDVEFAQNLAEDIGALQADLSWPHSCIDWDHAARELMWDYFEIDGYYFRSM